MQQPQQRSSTQAPTALRSKLQSLKVEHRAYLFVLMMGVLGAAFGGVTTEVELQGCLQSGECFLVNTMQQRFKGIEKGAFAGMGAAVLLSLPAVLKE